MFSKSIYLLLILIYLNLHAIKCYQELWNYETSESDENIGESLEEEDDVSSETPSDSDNNIGESLEENENDVSPETPPEPDEKIVQSQEEQQDISQQIEEEDDEQQPIAGEPIQITKEHKTCGLNHVENTTDKIVRGHEARIGQFPYQVLLKISNSNNLNAMMCGGSILNERYVLTAAHCVTYEKTGESFVKSVEITAGLHNRKFKGLKAQNRFADCVIVHEKWKGLKGGFANDIAILRLPQSNPFNITHDIGGIVNTICLPPKTEPPYKATGSARVSGWGVTGTTPQKSTDILQFTDVGLISDKNCSKNSFPFPIVDSMLCQGIDRTSPCFGDSGGPLVVKIDNRYVQVGVVSTGPSQCANNKDPNGIYTEVSYYLDWIKNAVEKNEKTCSGKSLKSKFFE